MNALNNHLTHAFFDDMARLGTRFWLKWGVIALVFGFLLDGVLPFALILGLVLGANLLVAAGVTYWWEKIGREKYAGTTILDIGEAVKERRKNQ